MPLWLMGYGVIAVLVAGAVFAGANWVRDGRHAAPARPGTTALLAGLLWPLVAVGAVQIGIIVGVRRLRSRGGSDSGTLRRLPALRRESVGEPSGVRSERPDRGRR